MPRWGTLKLLQINNTTIEGGVGALIANKVHHLRDDFNKSYLKVQFRNFTSCPRIFLNTLGSIDRFLEHEYSN